jgi:hypothetical protein
MPYSPAINSPLSASTLHCVYGATLSNAVGVAGGGVLSSSASELRLQLESYADMKQLLSAECRILDSAAAIVKARLLLSVPKLCHSSIETPPKDHSTNNGGGLSLTTCPLTGEEDGSRAGVTKARTAPIYSRTTSSADC